MSVKSVESSLVLKNSLFIVYRKYRDPILLSSIELLFRLREIVSRQGIDFLKPEIIDLEIGKPESNYSSDPYFLKYKFNSTIYRLCSFLGWLELYRREVAFLDSGQSRVNKKLDNCIFKIQSTFADGHLNQAQDWENWHDAQIFREEQRAIGEEMIENSIDNSSIMGSN